MAAAELPVGLAQNPRSDWCVGGVVVHGQPLNPCPGTPPLYIALATGAHQPWFGWAPPIRARVRGPFDPLGSNGIEINLTFPPLISTLLLTLYFLVYLFHHILVHRACFIVTAQLPIESYSYNIRYVQKQILFLLGLSRNHKAFP